MIETVLFVAVSAMLSGTWFLLGRVHEARRHNEQLLSDVRLLLNSIDGEMNEALRRELHEAQRRIDDDDEPL